MNPEVDRLREILNSGKIEGVPGDDLMKLETQFYSFLQHVRSMKSFTME